MFFSFQNVSFQDKNTRNESAPTSKVISKRNCNNMESFGFAWEFKKEICIELYFTCAVEIHINERETVSSEYCVIIIVAKVTLKSFVWMKLVHNFCENKLPQVK